MHIQSIPFANVASIQFCFRDTSVPTFHQEWFNSIEVTYLGGGRDLTPQDASTKRTFLARWVLTSYTPSNKRGYPETFDPDSIFVCFHDFGPQYPRLFGMRNVI